MSDKQDPFDCEALRPPEYVCVPDPRTRMFVKVDMISGNKSKMSIDHQHDDIAVFLLNKAVPRDVVIKFETAKNLYLYAWFIYRFYNVAEHEVLTCLEMALHQRFKDEGWYRDKRFPPTLKPLLERTIDLNLVKKEGFRAWRDRAKYRARERFFMEKMAEMEANGTKSFEYSDDDIQVTKEDEDDWDFLSVLMETLPFTRNDYAHGSSRLNSSVLHSFEVVSEFINQLYPDVTEA